MKEILPEKLKILASSLTAPLYVVGGSCRDYIAGLNAPARDWDISAPASAEEVCAAAIKSGFEVCATYKNTGTVRLKSDGEDYEFTSFRTDKYVRGEHTPSQVFFTGDITLDARRRDFRCNAIYYDVRAERFCDPLGGMEDARNRVMNTVAPSDKVFGEDGLRLMRLCRIAAQTGFTPTEECMRGAYSNRALIGDIAAERVWAELNALLLSDVKYGISGGQYAGLKLLNAIGVLAIILPELAEGEGMYQRSDYHDHDVLEHSLRCVKYAPPGIRLSALLHDVGKPYCKNTTGRYSGHEIEGARIAYGILTRLRAPVKLTERVCRLVKLHMYDVSCAASDNKVRKFIVANLDVFPDLLLLKQADFSACKDDLSLAPCVAKWKRIYSEMVNEGVPMSLKELDVKGDELIAEGVPPALTGGVLEFLLGECAIGALPNIKDRLIARALARVREISN